MAVKSKYRSFLVINTFGIGDMLFSTPLLRNLRDNFPKAKIYYLCNKKTAPLLKNHPLVHKIFVYERDDFVAEQKRSFFLAIIKYWRFISEIRSERIDCAIDLSLNVQFGFFAFLAGIKNRIGLDYKNRSKFLNKKFKIEGFTDKHAADYYLDVLKLIGLHVKKCALEIYSDLKSDRWADDFFGKNGIKDGDLVIGVAPCGGDAFGKDNHLKRWPADKFSRLIDELVKAHKAKVFIFAGPKEKKDVEGIMSSLGTKVGVFEFSEESLERTVSLVKRCDLFISNDTGILRFADALGKRIVALYGPIDEKVYGFYPYRDDINVVIKKDLPCRPCYRNFRLNVCGRDRECLTSISVDEVFTAAGEVLKKRENL